MHVVIAVPYRANQPLDPSWYLPETIDEFANLLSANNYTASGYFVSFDNIQTFLNDMAAMYTEKDGNMCVLNLCDGGEWDGYPGISVVREWEKHPNLRKIPISGSDAQFILNSDDKIKMNSFLEAAKLKVLPEVIIPSDVHNLEHIEELIEYKKLDNHWPLFCKLNVGAGALGICSESIMHNINEVHAQVLKMQKEFPDCDLLIQPYLPGPEYTVLVINDYVPMSVRRDYDNQYNIMAYDYLRENENFIEDRIIYKPGVPEAHELAIKAIKAIPGRHHYTRVDVRDDGKGNLYVLDINDRPALGDPSTIKCMLGFNKLSEPDLMHQILKTAVPL